MSKIVYGSQFTLKINGEEIGLVKADFGPYASKLHKFDLFHNEEHRLDSSNGLKFLHFNNPSVNRKSAKSFFKQFQNRTVAALALSPNGIKKTAASFISLAPDAELMIPMVVGVALVSRDDNYNRSVGRDQSVKQMAEIDMKVIGLTVSETHIFVRLAPYQGVSLSLRLNRKTGFSTVVGQLAGTV